jgi:hypothetical protein
MNFQRLRDLKNDDLNKKIFTFITKNIKNTIFDILGYKFYRKIYLVNNYKNIFFYKNKNRLLILISYISSKSELQLKKEIIKYLILNPIKIILFFKNIKFLFKSTKSPKNYIQLLHLIIAKSKMPITDKIFVSQKIHALHKKFISRNYKGIYAAYSNKNIAAKKYYERNKYILYNKNLFFSFVKRKIY